MTPLQELKRTFAATNERFGAGVIDDAKEMKRVADDLERSFGEGREPDHEIILKILHKLVQKGVLTGYREIKTACYGLLLPVMGRASIADDPGRLEQVLS